ncbi:hypothetical protein FQA39_LY11135 [Lamprigera yunnana]|nr:hypothetical protein FQA39_LY11135 [Lamprigera yunnana]
MKFAVSQIFVKRLRLSTLQKKQGRELSDSDTQKANNYSPYTCNFDHMGIESKAYDGLIFTLKLKYRMCFTEKFVKGESPGDNLNVNSAALLATVSTRLGFAQQIQILSTTNMPHLPRRQFDKHFENVRRYERSRHRGRAYSFRNLGCG